jgi:hypothetical protein
MRKYLYFITSLLLFTSFLIAQTPTPGDLAVGVSQSTASVSWTDFNEGPSANGPYDVEFDDDPAFGSVDASATATASLSLSLPALQFNTNYYWRVRDADIDDVSGGNQAGSWVEFSFKTGFPDLSLDSPADGSALNDRTPDLTWSVSSAVSNVEYTVANTAGPTNFTNTQNTLSYTTPTLNYGEYIWDVTIDDAGNIPLDNASSLSANGPFSFDVVPELVAPANTLTGVSILPTFEWVDDGNASYKVQIATSNDFINDQILEVVIGAGADSYKLSGTEDIAVLPLENNTIYWWRVVAVVGGNDFPSNPWSFRTVNDLTISAGNPLDGADVFQYDPLLFSWFINQAQGSLKFGIQIIGDFVPTEYHFASFEITGAQNAPGLDPDFFYDNINDLFKSVNGLEGGKTYYWRVFAYYDDGSTPGEFDVDDRLVKHSPIYDFTTAGGAVEAFPSWPTGGATVYTLQPYFYWYTLEYEPSATFEVIVSTSNSVDGVTGELNAGTISTYAAGSNLFVQATADLDPGTVYYWQVKTTYGSDDTFSAVETFETDAIAGVVAFVPTPSYPVDGATVYTTSPYLYWYVGGVSTDLLFEVEVSTDINFNNIVIDQNGISGLFYQGSGLTAGVSYFWRVRSYENGNPGNISTWSAPGEFTVAGGGSSYTVASYPVSNPTVYSATPTLSWYVEGSTLGWTGYVVRWVEANTAPTDWSNAAQYDGTTTINDINQTTYTFGSALNYGSTYYWAVALTNGGAPAHDDFAVGSFTVVGGSTSTVIPTTPANNTTVYSNDVTFYWYLSGSYLGLVDYSLRYSQQANMGNPTTINGITNNFHEVTGLTPGATYYWQVQGNYGATQTAWSTTYSFAIVAGSAPVVPRIGSPANGVTIETGSPILSWFNPVVSSSELTYDVELANNENFADAVVYTDLAQLKAEASNLESGQYFWRVRSKTNSEISGYSATGNFKVKDGITSVEEEEVLPTVFGLEQNYPNPFNPTTTIKFSLPESHFVSIKIYNMLGQEVRTLVNDQSNQGTYNVVWNGKDNYGNQVASGTYIYRISAGDFVSTKKMVLLK